MAAARKKDRTAAAAVAHCRDPLTVPVIACHADQRKSHSVLNTQL